MASILGTMKQFISQAIKIIATGTDSRTVATSHEQTQDGELPGDNIIAGAVRMLLNCNDNVEALTKLSKLTAGIKAENESKLTTTFTCFQNLPIELRIKIWNTYLEEPDILAVDIRHEIDRGNLRAADLLGYLFLQRRTSKAVVLWINKESRQEARRKLNMLYGNRPPDLLSWRAMFNGETDIVWLMNFSGFYNQWDQPAVPLGGIERLAINSQYWYDSWGDGDWLKSTLCSFREFGGDDVEELILIVGSEDLTDYRKAQFIEPRLAPSHYKHLSNYAGGMGWDELGKAASKEMQKYKDAQNTIFKEKVAIHKKQRETEGGFEDDSEYDPGDDEFYWYWAYGSDSQGGFRHIKVPIIRFREVVEMAS